MTLDEFIASRNNKFVDMDGQFGAQCWDLVEDYAEQLGVPKEPWAVLLGPTGSAYEAWNDFDSHPHMQQYFTKIIPGGQQRGDINVYGPKPGFPAGHICIELGNSQVFQQNASQEGSPAHTEARTTSYLLGSLRIKEIDMSTITSLDLARILAYSILGETGQNGTVNALSGAADEQLNRDFVGKPVEDVTRGMYNSPQGQNYLTHIIPSMTVGNVTPYSGPPLFVEES